MVRITINGNEYDVPEDATVASAATASGVYIPGICQHPDLAPFHDLPPAPRVFRGGAVYDRQPVPEDEYGRLEGCGLCVVEVEGAADPGRACRTPATAGMSVRTDSDSLAGLRRTALMKILARHPHACLTCAQREGCSLEDCSADVAKEERCCSLFHNCELRKVAEYVGVKEETPRYRPAGLPVLDDEPLFSRDYSLCIDCARCVRVCNQVRGVEAMGIVHQQGRLIVGSVAPTLIDSGCKFCGACVEVCPTGCLTDKGAQVGERSHWLVPCAHTCPAGADVPGYIRRIRTGDFKGAAALVWETLPLPNVLGHICFHECEYVCRRAEVDEPIAICALKRFALEAGGNDILSQAKKPAPSGKKVAVVGAGPAGLTAAYFLTLMGHAVTVFEASETAGGMPALSVPTYRLPQGVLEKDLAVIRGLGVEIRTGCRVSISDGPAGREGKGFEAMLVAVGLPNSKKLEIAGSGLEGVLWGLEFLLGAKVRKGFNLGKRIVVVGGGNVAIDVAMTALRLSGALVRLFCLESREEIPAHAAEVEKAEAEGVEVGTGWGPAAILGEGDQVTGVEFRKCIAAFDKQGRFAPTFDEQERMTVEADTVILAIGQAPSEGSPAEGDGLFLAGDAAGEPSSGGSVVHAVASGRAAAERIDRYLGGEGRVSVQLVDHSPAPAWIGRDEGFAPRPCVRPPCAAPEERRTDFRPIESTYARTEAVAEAERCLQCDLRLSIAPPVLPPGKWIDFNRAKVDEVPAVEGVLILADAGRKTVAIKGAQNIRAELFERLESPGAAQFFLWEEDKMYSKRESELIQQHLTEYGEMPTGGDDDLDDLF